MLYTHKAVADGLVNGGLVTKDDSGAYHMDMAKAVDAMVANTTWPTSDTRQVRAVPHRLDRSGEVELRQRIRGASCHGAQRRAAGHGRFGGARRQDHRSIFAKSGWMETSSEDSFNQFLTLGVGSKPMMVGYESQLLDLAVNQPDAFKQIKNDVVIVYPTRPCGAPTR